MCLIITSVLCKKKKNIIDFCKYICIFYLKNSVNAINLARKAIKI